MQIIYGSELTNMQTIISELTRHIGNNLYALVCCGSVETDDYREHWSDIDLIIVVEKISFSVKQNVACCIKRLEDRLGRHIGINLVTRKEITHPKKPEYFLPGKTLQALRESYLQKKPPLYIRNTNSRFIIPRIPLVKRYSLLNIGMFLIRNRRTLSKQVLISKDDYQKLTIREIRASFTITKLALQYFSDITYRDKQKILHAAKRQFPKFNFIRLEAMLTEMSTIQRTQTINHYRKMLKRADSYIEEFAAYVQKRVT